MWRIETLTSLYRNKEFRAKTIDKVREEMGSWNNMCTQYIHLELSKGKKTGTDTTGRNPIEIAIGGVQKHLVSNLKAADLHKR